MADIETPPTVPESREQAINRIAAKFEEADAKPTAPAPEPVKSDPEPPADAPIVAEGAEETPDAPEGEEGAEPKAAADGEPEGEGETEDEISDEFKEAAEAAKLPLSLDDLPEEARPLVQKKLKDMEAGFTRAMQRATAYRTEQAKRDEEYAAFQAKTKNPRDYVIDLLVQAPTLLDEINTELERLQEPRYAEARKRDREAEEKLARIEAREQTERQERLERRAQEVTDYVERLCQANGLPAELVEDAIANKILERRQMTGDPDISEADIDAIVKARAALYRKHVGHVKRVTKQEYVRQKAEDRKTGAPRVKHSSAASTPAPKPAPPAKTLAEKMERTAARLFPDAA